MSVSGRSNPAPAEAGPRFSLSAVRATPRYTYLVAAVAAIGGMLFGYDIGVISGAENLLKAVSWNLGSFLAFRILTGVAVGASSLVVPLTSLSFPRPASAAAGDLAAARLRGRGRAGRRRPPLARTGRV